jgi:hypothetical protein
MRSPANNAVSNFGNIGDTWVVSPNLLNVFRVGYKRYVCVNAAAGQQDLEQLRGQLRGAGRTHAAGAEPVNDYKLGSTSQA